MIDGPNTFAAEWAQIRGDTPPLGWMLRSDNAVPWVRLHALPGSKRYAETEAERSIVLVRGNAIGDRLLGPGSECWLVEARVGDEFSEDAVVGEFKEGDDPDELIWRFYVRPVEWRAGAFDAELSAIADDKLAAIWMRRNDGAVFAPYDGGFDLFPVLLSEIEMLRGEYADWLSSHPEGL